MTTTDYQPISCDSHSEYELLAIRRSWVLLDAESPEGKVQALRCQVVDVQTRDQAEYLEVLTEGGARRRFRLDRLSKLARVSD